MPPTAAALVSAAARRFEAAGLFYGHGTDNAEDEALFLVLHALGWSYEVPASALERALEPAQVEAVERLVRQRLETRRPAAYLTGHTWFAGLEFEVDAHVLVPRSPLGELIGDGFAPWREAADIRRILDIGTGSGCIAIAAAVACPTAVVDATDTSAEALAVAARNVARHGLTDRVHLYEADLFPPGARTYDVIVSNPPYVPAASWATLPPEYHAEPRAALVAADAGQDCVARILRGAGARLAPDGVLIVEVGEIWPAVAARYPRLPFTWLEFARGGEGVFLLEAADLAAGVPGA